MVRREREVGFEMMERVLTHQILRVIFFFGTPSTEREAGGGERSINQQDSGSSTKVLFRSGVCGSFGGVKSGEGEEVARPLTRGITVRRQRRRLGRLLTRHCRRRRWRPDSKSRIPLHQYRIGRPRWGN